MFGYEDELKLELYKLKSLNKGIGDFMDKVESMLSMAKRIRGKAVDDGDHWEISDDVFQEVQKAFEEIKTASANEHD